jgi:hypothetical protein
MAPDDVDGSESVPLVLDKAPSTDPATASSVLDDDMCTPPAARASAEPISGRSTCTAPPESQPADSQADDTDVPKDSQSPVQTATDARAARLAEMTSVLEQLSLQLYPTALEAFVVWLVDTAGLSAADITSANVWNKYQDMIATLSFPTAPVDNPSPPRILPQLRMNYNAAPIYFTAEGMYASPDWIRDRFFPTDEAVESFKKILQGAHCMLESKVPFFCCFCINTVD